MESKSNTVKCDSDYQKVVSSGHKNLSSLSHSRYESVHKDKITPHIPSVQSPDYPECGKSRVLTVPESAVQSPDSPRNEKVHVHSVQDPDFKEERGRDSSQYDKNENVFSSSSGTKINNTTLRAENFEYMQENFDSNPHSSMQDALLPHAGFYLPAGWYVNVGPAYCAGCQLYGTLLRQVQV